MIWSEERTALAVRLYAEVPIKAWRSAPSDPPYLVTINIGPRRRRTMREIAAEVCARHGITLAELTGPSRCRRFAHPRQEFMALAYKLEHTTTPMIGRFLGGRDHSTICLGIKAHNRRVAL